MTGEERGGGCKKIKNLTLAKESKRYYLGMRDKSDLDILPFKLQLLGEPRRGKHGGRMEGWEGFDGGKSSPLRFCSGRFVASFTEKTRVDEGSCHQKGLAVGRGLLLTDSPGNADANPQLATLAEKSVMLDISRNPFRCPALSRLPSSL